MKNQLSKDSSLKYTSKQQEYLNTLINKYQKYVPLFSPQTSTNMYSKLLTTFNCKKNIETLKHYQHVMELFKMNCGTDKNIIKGLELYSDSKSKFYYLHTSLNPQVNEKIYFFIDYSSKFFCSNCDILETEMRIYAGIEPNDVKKKNATCFDFFQSIDSLLRYQYNLKLISLG